MSPKGILCRWVDLFNRHDAGGLAELYAENATCYQVPNDPIIGKDEIYEMFVTGFASGTSVCVVENIFEDGQWSIMEWKDSCGMLGCSFFHVVNEKIIFQRSYWDKISMFQHRGWNYKKDDQSS